VTSDQVVKMSMPLITVLLRTTLRQAITLGQDTEDGISQTAEDCAV